MAGSDGTGLGALHRSRAAGRGDEDAGWGYREATGRAVGGSLMPLGSSLCLSVQQGSPDPLPHDHPSPIPPSPGPLPRGSSAPRGLLRGARRRARRQPGSARRSRSPKGAHGARNRAGPLGPEAPRRPPRSSRRSSACSRPRKARAARSCRSARAKRASRRSSLDDTEPGIAAARPGSRPPAMAAAELRGPELRARPRSAPCSHPRGPGGGPG